MKKTILVLTILVISSLTYGQIDSLKKELSFVKDQNKILRIRIVKIDKRFYDTEKKKLNIAITLGIKLTEKWNSLQNSVAISNGLNRITQINSIGSDNALGLKFDETIKEMIEDNLTKSLDRVQSTSEQVNVNTKKRWKTVVSRILNNDIVQGLVNSNPFTSIASSVINSAIGFTSHDVKTSADIKLVPVGDLPNRYKNYRNEWKDKYDIIGATSINSYDSSQLAITNEAIELFSEAIEPYISLYNDMAQSNLKFQIQIEELSRLHIDYKDIISTYDKKLLEHLSITKLSEMPERINDLTKVDENVYFPSYRETMEKEELEKALYHANQYSILREKVNELNIKFYDIHIVHFVSYLKHLNTALINTEAGKTKFDKVSILKTKEFLEEQIEICKKAKKDLLLKE